MAAPVVSGTVALMAGRRTRPLTAERREGESSVHHAAKPSVRRAGRGAPDSSTRSARCGWPGLLTPAAEPGQPYPVQTDVGQADRLGQPPLTLRRDVAGPANAWILGHHMGRGKASSRATHRCGAPRQAATTSCGARLTATTSVWGTRGNGDNIVLGSAGMGDNIV